MTAPIVMQERKLGREKALGIAWRHGKLIEIHPGQNQKERIDTILHEALHIICPDWSERKVAATAKQLTKLLWKDGYRRLAPKHKA